MEEGRALDDERDPHDRRRARDPNGFGREREGRREARRAARERRGDGIAVDRRPVEPSRSRRRRSSSRTGAVIVIVLLVILGALVWFAANTDTSISAVNPSSPAAASAGVTADSGQDLLALANDPAGLAQLEAHTVAATDVPVQSVVSDQGFWVGSTTNRIFVFTRQPIQIAAGQTVTFSGVVTVLPIDFQTRFGVDPLDGAAELQTQGHYVAVSDVTATSPTG